MARSQRLTVELRTTICNGLLKHALAEDKAQLERDSLKAAEEAYAFLYSPEREKEMLRAPAGAYACIKNMRIHLPEENIYRLLLLPSPRLFFFAHSDGWLDIKPDPKLRARITKLERDTGALTDKRSRLQDEIRAVLLSVSTVSALLKQWPEVKEFIPEKALRERNTAIAVIPSAELNSSLGLPIMERK